MAAFTWRDAALFLKSFTNLKITVTSNTQTTITADQVVLTSSTMGYIASSVSLTNTITTSGANGLDTGAEASNTWYSVWVIYNGTTVASLISTSTTSPTLPSGYTFKARVGWIRNDASSNLYRTQQNNDFAQYIIGTNPNAGIQMDYGTTSGSTDTPTTSIALTSYLPTSTAIAIYGTLYCSNSHIAVAPNNSYGSYASTTNAPPAGITIGSGQMSSQFNFLLQSNTIYWASNGSSNAVYITGWQDSIS